MEGFGDHAGSFFEPFPFISYVCLLHFQPSASSTKDRAYVGYEHAEYSCCCRDCANRDV